MKKCLALCLALLLLLSTFATLGFAVDDVTEPPGTTAGSGDGTEDGDNTGGTGNTGGGGGETPTDPPEPTEPTDPPAEDKDITVRFGLLNVSGAPDTLEVGVYVQTKNDKTFQRLSAVLELDASVLAPMYWSKTEQYDLTAATTRETAIPLESKKPDDLFGASAFAYTKDGKTYLDISAEAQTAISCAEPEGGKRVMTLRLGYGKNADESSKTKTDVIPGTTIAIAQDLSVLYDSNAQHGVRFFTGDDTHFYRPVTEEEGTDTLIADTTIPDDHIIAVTGLDTAIPDGDSMTYVDPSNYGSIVFYDWDGSTLLGAVTVSKNASQAAIQSDIQKFADSLKASAEKEADYADKVNAADGYYSSVDENGVDKGEKYPLTYKKAYRFEDVWLYATSPAFECYMAEKEETTEPTEEGGEPTTTIVPDNDYYTADDKPENHDILSSYAADERPSYSQITADIQQNGVVLLKAAYKAESNINVGGRTYTVGDVTYNRYGSALNATGVYSIKQTVRRENAAGNGVHRLHNPTIRVTLAPEAAPTAVSYLAIQLANQDAVNFEVASHKMVATVTMVLIDMEYAPAWASTAREHSARSTFNNRANKVQGTDGFVKDGTVALINELGINVNKGDTTNWTGYINRFAFLDAGLTKGGVAMPANQVTAARNAITTALAANGNKPLTHWQMQWAIDYDGALTLDLVKPE